MTAASLMWGILFSVIGLSLFRHGKKEAEWIPLLAGVLLFIVPYIIPNTYWMVAVCLLITATPWAGDIFWKIANTWPFKR